ncbi:MAG: hypothetical protein P3X22_007220 [Thermoprotei archaeon]|nr:hypothetical protein [Thermoprotei archaeon]
MRSTIAWVKCELCGRRGQTFECLAGKIVVNLCIYCATVLSASPKVKCKAPLVSSVGGFPAPSPREGALEELPRKSPPTTGKRAKTR